MSTVLDVSPLAMVSVLFSLSALVVVGSIETVMAVAAVEVALRVAVTVLAFPLPLSLMVAGVSTRVTCGFGVHWCTKLDKT